MKKGEPLTRRDVLKRGGMFLLGLAATACGAQPPAPKPAETVDYDKLAKAIVDAQATISNGATAAAAGPKGPDTATLVPNTATAPSTAPATAAATRRPDATRIPVSPELPSWWPKTPAEAAARWTPGVGNPAWWKPDGSQAWVMEAGDTRVDVDTSKDGYRSYGHGWDPDYKIDVCGLKQGRYMVETGTIIPKVVQAVVRAVDQDPNQAVRARREMAINLGADFLVNEPNLNSIAFAVWNWNTNQYQTFVKVGEQPGSNDADQWQGFPTNSNAANNLWTPGGNPGWWKPDGSQAWVMEAGDTRVNVNISKDGNHTYGHAWDPDYKNGNCNRLVQGRYLVGNDVIFPSVVQAVVRSVDNDSNQAARGLREAAINLGADFLVNERNLGSIAFGVWNPRTRMFQTFIKVG